MIPRRRPPVVVPRYFVVFCIIALTSFVAVGLGIGTGLINLVLLGLVSLGIVGLVSLVTVGRDSLDDVVVGFIVGVSLLALIAILAFLGLDGLAVFLVAGLALLALLAILSVLFAFAIGLIVVHVVDNARNVNDNVWRSESSLPQIRSLAWMRGLLPPGEGAAWLAEATSTLAETPDSAQRSAYVRSYRRRLPHLFWTSWVLYLSSARRREVS